MTPGGDLFLEAANRGPYVYTQNSATTGVSKNKHDHFVVCRNWGDALYWLNDLVVLNVIVFCVRLSHVFVFGTGLQRMCTEYWRSNVQWRRMQAAGCIQMWEGRIPLHTHPY